MTENDTEENDQGQHGEHRHQRRDGFWNTLKGYLPAAHGHRGHTNKEHAGVGDQEEEGTVLQQHGPETGLCVFILTEGQEENTGY